MEPFPNLDVKAGELTPHQKLQARLREITASQPMETAWEQLWKEGTSPWDAQGVNPVVAQLVKENQIREGRVLVPGCGSGYDVVAMASPNRRVVGLDISETALQGAKAHASKCSSSEFVEFLNADFFTYNPPQKFDAIFDYTFFCAFPPSVRPQWAEKMAELLALDGELITLIFPIADHEGGPPYAVSVEAYEQVLRPWGFQLTSCEDDIPSLARRKGQEKLARWARTVSKA